MREFLFLTQIMVELLCDARVADAFVADARVAYAGHTQRWAPQIGN